MDDIDLDYKHEPVSDLERVIEQFFESDEIAANNWRAHTKQVNELLSKDELYAMPLNRSCPVLVRRPNYVDYKEHSSAMRLISRGNKGAREKLQSEQNENTNYAMAHCVYPTVEQLKKIATSSNYQVFEQICSMLEFLSSDDAICEVVKLAKL